MPPSKIDLFKKLGNYDEATGKTRIVNTTEFEGDYSGLVCSNGGSWCRFDGKFGTMYKVVMVKRDGTNRKSWDSTDEENTGIDDSIKDYMLQKKYSFTSGQAIYLIMIYGTQVVDGSRAIRKDIRDTIIKDPCVSCGTKSNIECDHKNDLYNDPRVNDVSTQRPDDFQPLCKHCNDQKRQIAKDTKNTGKRYGATKIPSLAVFGIDFIEGNEDFDSKSITAMVGTYWYDPVAFTKYIKDRFTSFHQCP